MLNLIHDVQNEHDVHPCWLSGIVFIPAGTLQYFVVFAQSLKLVNKKNFLMQTCQIVSAPEPMSFICH